MPKYLSDEHERVYRTEADYVVEDGVVLDHQDFVPRHDSREYHDRQNRLLSAFPSKVQREAEEIAWAKRSGPVFTIKRPATLATA